MFCKLSNSEISEGKISLPSGHNFTKSEDKSVFPKSEKSANQPQKKSGTNSQFADLLTSVIRTVDISMYGLSPAQQNHTWGLFCLSHTCDCTACPYNFVHTCELYSSFTRAVVLSSSHMQISFSFLTSVASLG
jgi:hypothetical protein